MAIAVDIIIVAILALCVFSGYRKGLSSCLINVMAFFIAIIISFALFKPASEAVIANTQLDENIQYSIVKVFESDEIQYEQNENTTPILKYISEEVAKSAEEKKNEVVENVAKELSVKIMNILVFIILFIVARILLMFIKILTNFITKLPIIKQCDKIGGVIYGILQALIIVYIALALITFVSTMTAQYSLLETINQSYIGKFLSNNNILLKIIF